jgi:hypothetical protein
MDKLRALLARLQSHAPLNSVLGGRIVRGSLLKVQFPAMSVNPLLPPGEQVAIDPADEPAELVIQLDAWTEGEDAKKRAKELRKIILECLAKSGPVLFKVIRDNLVAADKHGHRRRVSIDVVATEAA